MFTRPTNSKPASDSHSTEKWKVGELRCRCRPLYPQLQASFNNEACVTHSVCAASLSQKDKCGFHQMYFARFNARQSAHISIAWDGWLGQEEEGGEWVWQCGSGWCTSCESIGSEIMAVPLTTVLPLVDTHVQCSLYIIHCTLYKRKSGSEMMAVPPLWSLVDIVTRTACCPDHRLLSFILHIFNWSRPDHSNIYLELLAPDRSWLVQ